MNYKHDFFKDQLDQGPRKLKKIAEFMDEVSRSVAKKDLFITRVWDDAPGQQTEVHRYKRAFDARVQYAGVRSGVVSYYSEAQAAEIANRVNHFYPREDGKLVVMVHKVEGGMLHIHCQIPANWIEKDEAIMPVCNA